MVSKETLQLIERFNRCRREFFAASQDLRQAAAALRLTLERSRERWRTEPRGQVLFGGRPFLMNRPILGGLRDDSPPPQISNFTYIATRRFPPSLQTTALLDRVRLAQATFTRTCDEFVAADTCLCQTLAMVRRHEEAWHATPRMNIPRWLDLPGEAYGITLESEPA